MAHLSLRTPAAKVFLALAVVYLVLAVGGFLTAGTDTFGYERTVRLFGVFGTSTVLNIVHAFVGLVALVVALRGAASAFAPVATVAFTALAVFGSVSRVFPGAGDPLNQTWWNVGLYLLSAAACGYAFVASVRART